MKRIATFIIISALLLCALVSFGGINLKAAEQNLHYIVTTPGEDSAHEISVNWHSFADGSYLELTKANDPNFTNAKKYTPNSKLWSTKDFKGTETNTTFYTKERYVCNVEFTDLEPRTKYIYRVVCGDEVSITYKFQTSGLTNKWNFIAFVDFQNRKNTIMHPLINMMYELADEPALAVCSGDMVDTAGEEFEWEWVLDNKVWSNFVYASSPGDHEYWASSTVSPHPQYEEPYTYNALFDFPKNGCDLCKNSNYYFYYNNVLFVMLDMSDSDTSSGAKFNAEVAWFKKTIKELEGTYQYLIVFNHKSIYSSYSNDSSVAKKIRPQWYPVFDEFNVDLVISGHDHMYSRTYPLYNNKVSKKDKVGTYYLDMGSSGDKRRELDSAIAQDGLHEKVIDIVKNGWSFGANVEVDEDKMVVIVYNQHGVECDKFEIKSKRDVLPIEIDDVTSKDFEGIANLNLTNKTDKTGKLVLSDLEATKYIESFKLYNDNGTCLESAYSFTNQSKEYKVSNLNTTKYKLDLTLVNGEVITVETLLNYGTLEGFKAEYKDGLVVKWNKVLITNDNLKYDLHIDGKLNKTLDSEEVTNRKINLTNDYLIGNHKFELVIYREDGTEYTRYAYDYTGLDALTVSETNVSINKGERKELTINFSNMDLVRVTTSNIKVASYEDGVIRTFGAGECDLTISILDSNIEYNVHVIVADPNAQASGCSNALTVIYGLISTLGLCAIGKFLLKKKYE